MIKSTLFDPAIVQHAFFTREGGVSEGVYAGLNCGAGSGDDAKNVAKNKSIAMQKLGLEAESLATLYQIHSTDVVLIQDKNQIPARSEADALVTTLPGVALGILTADCVPILFADAENRVIGAAHSGWKGAAGNIAKNVVDTMVTQGAKLSNIKAAVGPAIQQKSYEVGPDFPAPFLSLSENNSRFFVPSDREGHHMFDLTGFVLSQLDDLGILSVERLEHDTCAKDALFYSYRRMSKRGETDYGRLLSAIALNADRP